MLAIRPGRRNLLVIAVGYVSGAAALPWLPGPYLEPALPLLIRSAIAFLLPTAALVICASINLVFERPASGERHAASQSAIQAIASSTAWFVVGLHGLMLANLVGLPVARLSPPRLVVVLTGLLLVAIGNVLPRVRTNPVFGIRTRVLLSQPHIWAVVHRAAGYASVGLGTVMTVAGIAVAGPDIPLVASAALLVGIGIVATAYSRARA